MDSLTISDLATLPYDVRSLILAELTPTVSEIKEYRSNPVVAHLLARSIRHVILEEDTPVRDLDDLTNLQSVSSYNPRQPGLIVIDTSDFPFLYKLRDYTALFYEANNSLLQQFLELVPEDHFYHGRKLIVSQIQPSSFEIIDGHLNPSMNLPGRILKILVERQLFDSIFLSYNFLNFYFLGEYKPLDSIKYLRRVVIEMHPNLSKFRKIWKLPTSIEIDVSNFKLSSQQVKIANFLYFLKTQYVSLDNIQSFLGPMNPFVMQFGPSWIRDLFPNLVELGIGSYNYSPQVIQRYIEGFFRGLPKLQRVVIYHRGDFDYPEDPRVELFRLKSE